MATPAELLAEARLARHRILTMQAAVEIRDGNSGDTIRYSVANLSRLELYIRQLEAEIAGESSPRYQPLRPSW